VAFAVGSSLTIAEIVVAKDYSLAEAARPALGQNGVWFTIAIAMIATSSGLIASVFAVSRMLAMMTDMNLIPHRHFGMKGTIQRHTLVYAVVVAGFLAVFFDLSRIASLGAIFYLLMDIIIHWGVFKNLRQDVDANPGVLLTAIVLDIFVLGAFLIVKGASDPIIIYLSFGGIALIFLFEKFYLGTLREEIDNHSRRMH